MCLKAPQQQRPQRTPLKVHAVLATPGVEVASAPNRVPRLAAAARATGLADIGHHLRFCPTSAALVATLLRWRWLEEEPLGEERSGWMLQVPTVGQHKPSPDPGPAHGYVLGSDLCRFRGPPLRRRQAETLDRVSAASGTARRAVYEAEWRLNSCLAAATSSGRAPSAVPEKSRNTDCAGDL